MDEERYLYRFGRVYRHFITKISLTSLASLLLPLALTKFLENQRWKWNEDGFAPMKELVYKLGHHLPPNKSHKSSQMKRQKISGMNTKLSHSEDAPRQHTLCINATTWTALVSPHIERGGSSSWISAYTTYWRWISNTSSQRGCSRKNRSVPTPKRACIWTI